MILSDHYSEMMRIEVSGRRATKSSPDGLGVVNEYAIELLKGVRKHGIEMERVMLEKIREICKVAMSEEFITPEESNIALSDKVAEMVETGSIEKNFVAYLKYAVAEERERIVRLNRGLGIESKDNNPFDDYEFDPADPEVSAHHFVRLCECATPVTDCATPVTDCATVLLLLVFSHSLLKTIFSMTMIESVALNPTPDSARCILGDGAQDEGIC